MDLNPKQQLQVWKAWIKRWSELTIEEIDRDIAAIDRADEFNEVFLAARWAEAADRLSAATVSRTEPVHLDEILTGAELEQRWELMCKHFGLAPSSKLPVDVGKTLEWMKQGRVANTALLGPRDLEERPSMRPGGGRVFPLVEAFGRPSRR